METGQSPFSYPYQPKTYGRLTTGRIPRGISGIQRSICLSLLQETLLVPVRLSSSCGIIQQVKVCVCLFDSPLFPSLRQPSALLCGSSLHAFKPCFQRAWVWVSASDFWGNLWGQHSGVQAVPCTRALWLREQWYWIQTTFCFAGPGTLWTIPENVDALYNFSV